MQKLLLVLLPLLLCQASVNAQTWAPVGSGVNSSSDALAIYNGQLVSGGRYSSLVKWDGTNWSDFTATGNPSATSILVEGNDLYAGGQFTGGNSAKVISKYDGSAWSVVGGGENAYTNVNWNTNNRWWSIFKFNGNLYGLYDGGLMKYDAGATQFVNTGDPVTDLGSAISGLRYGGVVSSKAYFSGMVDGTQRVITWDDTHWDTLDLSNYPGRGIEGLQVLNNELYIGGVFPNVNSNLSGMLKWDGSLLTEVLGVGASMPLQPTPYVTAGNLYAKYTRSGVKHIGIWNGTSFTDLGGEIFGAVGSLNAVAELNGIVYAGGFFTTFDGTAANNIAQRSISTGVSATERKSNFRIYPNPATDQITIMLGQPLYKLEIYNASGSLILTTTKSIVALNNFSSGIYFIRAYSKDAIETLSFTKQ